MFYPKLIHCKTLDLFTLSVRVESSATAKIHVYTIQSFLFHRKYQYLISVVKGEEKLKIKTLYILLPVLLSLFGVPNDLKKDSEVQTFLLACGDFLLKIIQRENELSTFFVAL